MLFTLFVLSFVFSFLFALGGVGSAIVLVPLIYWLGFPLNEAKPTGLFVNTISLLGATYSNIKSGKLDFKMGLPVIIFSFIFAPVGAYVSVIIPKAVVLAVFVVFLLFSSIVMIFFKSSKYEKNYREDTPFLVFSLIGILAGFLSGLLGVGGGGFIAPSMVLLGFNPKKVAALTAFVVPFSSFAAFLIYLGMETVNITVLLVVGIAAYFGGYFGTVFMQNRMKATTVKKFLGLILLVIAVKMIFKLIN